MASNKIKLALMVLVIVTALLGLGWRVRHNPYPIFGSGGDKIEYVETGGLANIVRSLTIDVDSGRTVFRQNGSIYIFWLEDGTVTSLQALLDKVQLEQIKRSADRQCCDQMAYTIRYDGIEVQVTDLDVPDDLWLVIDQLQVIIATHTRTITSITTGNEPKG